MNQLTPTISPSDCKPAEIQDADLLKKLQHAEAAVRAKPMAHEHRWALVELHCQLCQWDRALQQLQVWVRLAPQWKTQAHVVRGLIQAEHQRARVFLGHERAAPVIDFPLWMQDMARALEHNAADQTELADTCREQALEQAPCLKGECHWDERMQVQGQLQSNCRAFEWLSDSDTRLGPICEVMVAGAYRWLAFADITALHMQAPQNPLDLVWVPAKLQLRVGTANAPGKNLHAFIPARSCWPQPPKQPSEQQQALMMGRLSVWEEVGETGVFVQGQKTWMSEGIDWPLLDVREIRT